MENSEICLIFVVFEYNLNDYRNEFKTKKVLIDMLKVFIQGLKDGIYDVEAECPVEQIADIFPEFFGTVRAKGSMRILGKRHTVNIIAECDAKLICDISLEEYTETITATLNVAYMADEELFTIGADSDIAAAEERIIHPDDKYIDITEEVREELCVSLPLKRVAPAYRDKDLAEIFPDLVPDNSASPTDDRWANLKNIKLN